MNAPAKNSELLRALAPSNKQRLEHAGILLEKELITLSQPNNQHAVQLNKLAGQLVLGPSPISVLTILSPGEKEGRTHLTANLGCAIAKYGKRVLLVDTDFKASHLHEMFNCANVHGLSDILWKKIILEPVVPCGSLPQLHLMPAGQANYQIDHNWPIEILRTWLNKMRASYDFIILDTPPAIGSYEALATATLADGCLLLARQDVTRYAWAYKLEEEIQRLGVALVGSVLKRF